MSDPIERQDAINEALKCRVIEVTPAHMLIDKTEMVTKLLALPSAQPESFVDADKLKRCRFEYINACKIVAHPTLDTSKSDIYDAHALIKALHPIFGDVEF